MNNMYGDRDGRGFGGGRVNDRAMTPPVREGEEREVIVEAVGEKGDGIAKIQGFVLFVPGAQKGDRVKVRVTKVLAKVGFVQVLEKLERPAAPVQQEFDPKEELDSESFGDEQ
jgi:predicted RNA-binding protein with TRAM domain